MSIYHLMRWRYTGSIVKSISEVNRLVQDVLLAQDFKVEDLKGFSMAKQNRLWDTKSDDTAPQSDGWREVDVNIDVPTRSSSPSGNHRTFRVSGLLYRPLVGVIKAAFSEPTSKWFHLYPFKRFRKHPVQQTDERVFDELYTSDAWLQAHDELQKQPREPGCGLEKVVAALMFSSDATMLASFGTAKAWPLYLSFGNLSKYARARPSSGGCHHVAFIPSLPDSITQFLSTIGSFTKSATRSLLTHCRRELVHAVWETLLDEEFVHAYRHGIVLKCADGIVRRVYPRIFTYSADYPEKILLATIRDKGEFLCPRCLVPRSKLDEVGFLRDVRLRFGSLRAYAVDIVKRARDFIYKKGKPVDGAAVKRLLNPGSLVPTMNAFAKRLGEYGFNHFPMLVVDIMHECELGTWKSLFIHLIRILYSLSPAGQLVAEVDNRFRQVPTFGRGVIRRFSDNASEMKRLAARDFEDLLQCSIPVFDGLFPHPHDALVKTALYRFAEWHALAKLRMHTDSSLSMFDKASKALSSILRKFRDETAKAYTTFELPKEREARQRRSGKNGPRPTETSSAPKMKGLNLKTYKFHAIGDYTRTIAQFGTTDSYTTQIGELAHRVIKSSYALTNKSNAIRQIAKHEVRRRRIHRTAASGEAEQAAFCPEGSPPGSCEPILHHHISDVSKDPKDIFVFVGERGTDPAVKDHLLYRLLNLDFDGDDHVFSDSQRNHVRILNNMLYSPATMQVNYTTYDVRREQDIVNPRAHGDVMVLSRESEQGCHPYWYARVLHVFHLRVHHCGPDARNLSAQHMEILWVRWFGIVPGHRYGSAVARLPKIGFVPDSDPSAFGFLDPSLVIRSCHLIPAFADGRTSDLLRPGPSVGRRNDEIDDWVSYFVNIFVDRDMYMRYNGVGVGHCFNPTLADGHNFVDEEECGSEDDMDVDAADTGDTSVSWIRHGGDEEEGDGDNDDDDDDDDHEEEEEEEEEEEDGDGDSDGDQNEGMSGDSDSGDDDGFDSDTIS
ncbi:hypothetical protein HYDPIDRAFT_141613 [Hydnomerulius pinastri MD-312]|uniref:Uncharacterized protein n=1 Tax=Hydnomerulius pinastri MD-312 TaxID=994086 RepID=A0A0C9VL44_9AGAM|nr:hypothetical protein HYDPIDRAFT_141613 [Hydnomerulius pinastri MD-312]